MAGADRLYLMEQTEKTAFYHMRQMVFEDVQHEVHAVGDGFPPRVRGRAAVPLMLGLL